MNGDEKSDLAIVAVKPANKSGRPDAEWVEPRAGAEGHAVQQNTFRHRTGQVCHMRWTHTRGGNGVALPSNTRGGSRMREFRPYGSVRGAPSNGRPYRDSDVLF